jgi:hypothetical protein
MSLTLDATLGGSQANSYLSLEDADAWFAVSLFAERWIVLSEATRTGALRQSATWLDTLTFHGERATPSSDEPALQQAMQWPRTGVTCRGITATREFIPHEIITAQMSLALQIGEQPDLLFTASQVNNVSFVTKERVDVLEQQFAAKPERLQMRDAARPWLIRAFPWLSDLLGCWYSSKNSTVRLYRN